MDLQPTKLNLQLAEVVTNRIAAELSNVSGRASFWRSIGLGLIGLGIGAATGLVFVGYSFVTRNSGNQALLTSALLAALNEVQLHANAEGKVQLEPHEIRLAKDQTVTISPDARVRLDPGAKVIADGDIKIQLPSISIPQTASPRGDSKIPIITNFTVFKSVPYAKGAVFTGWNFLTSAQKQPTNQYCYYTVENDQNPDVSLRIEIAQDGVMEKPKSDSNVFDFAAAYTKCVWFVKSSQ
jgi:hypothetical protein